MHMMEIVSRSHSYIVEGQSTLGAAVERVVGNGKVFALVDRFVLGAPYEGQLAAIDPANIFAIDATEEAKAFKNLADVFEWLLSHGFRRDCTLLAVGGGVTQDIACFIASVLLRGIRWHFVPTTLLAQCDSCIGSKSSINIGRYKNQIGTFYPPHSITLVHAVLRTLPNDEIRSGLGEAIKLHLLAGEEEFRWLKAKLNGNSRDDLPLSEIIWSSLKIKKPFIEEDEFDRGRRNLLNYGHTFGHAYESATSYSIPHGIAVTLGVLTATYISAQIGWVTQQYYEQLHSFLRPFFTPYHEHLLCADLGEILAAMKLDKKNTSNRVHCILTRGCGQMEKTTLESESELTKHLRAFIHSLP